MFPSNGIISRGGQKWSGCLIAGNNAHCCYVVTLLVMLHGWYCYTAGHVTLLVMLHCWYCYTAGHVTLLVMLHCWSCYTAGIVTLLVLLHCWSCYTVMRAEEKMLGGRRISCGVLFTADEAPLISRAQETGVLSNG